MRISDWSSDVCSSDLVAQALQGRIDAFVGAPGFEPLDTRAMLDEDWYARFDGAGESALPPDADLDPVTRGLLLFASQEAPLDTARYRITDRKSTRLNSSH